MVRRGPTAERAALALLFLSGLLALVYEICWIRKSAIVFGVTTFALSTVLAVFFGGLALGSQLFGRWSLRISRPLRAYGMLEIGVACLALLTPFGFTIADRAFGWLYGSVSHSFALLSLARFVVVVAIVLPPSVLMGGSLPLFARQLVGRPERIARSVAWIYGLNTAGAAIGCALCGLVLVHSIGVDRTIWLAGFLNLAVGMVALRLPVADPPPVEGVTTRERPRTLAGSESLFVGALFFLTGFVALANEVAWVRYLSLLVRNTVYTYTATLTVILAGIVLGAVLASRWLDRLRHRALVFGALQVATGIVVIFVLLSPASWWAAVIDTQRAVTLVAVAIVVLLPAAILSGASFPLAVRMVVERPQLAGPGVGTMLAVNTLGGIAGSLVAGFALLPRAGLQATALATSAASVAIGVLACLVLARSVSMVVRCCIAVAGIAAWSLVPLVSDTRLPDDFLARDGSLVDYREGYGSNMAVLGGGTELELQIDRVWQGQSGKTHQIMAAHVPMLLHPDPQRVAVVGLGTGQTASRFLMYPVTQLDCVELERDLVPLVRRHFESAWMDDPRARFVFDDGRNFLAHTDRTYDVISIEVGQLFRPGVAAFYTADFYRAARARLTPGGFISQFVPVESFTVDEFRTVVATFVSVFPQAVLWYNTSEFLLLGARDGDIRLLPERLALLQDDPTIHEDLRFAYWGGPAEWLHLPHNFAAGFLVGPRGLAEWGRGVAPYRDDRPWLEYSEPPRDREAAVRAIVSLVGKGIAPLSEIMPVAPGADWLAAVPATRARNVGDIVASTLLGIFSADRTAEGAVQLLGRAVRANPDNFAVRMDLGTLLLASRRPREAAEHYRHALDVRPDDARAHSNLGRAEKALGRTAVALEHFRRAAELDPDHDSAHYNLATALREQGALGLAIEHYRRAVELNPRLAHAHHHLGGLLATTGDLAGGRSHLEQAVRLDPDSAEARASLAEVYAALGMSERAVQSAQIAARLASSTGNAALERRVLARIDAYRREGAATTPPVESAR